MLGRSIAVGVLAYWSWSAWAQDIDPDACFCLRHTSGQLQRGCHAEKFPGQFFPTALCRDPENPEATSETLITNAWTVVPGGEEGCEVCRPDARDTEDLPRGDEEEAQ